VTLARFTPFALLRRYLAIREDELAVRRAALEDARRRTAAAIEAVWDEAYAVGQLHPVSAS
jgi:hypothetical protein